METINVRDEDRRREEEQENMAHEEVGAPERQLDDLHDEFTRRLGHRVRTQSTAVPLASPPCAVRLVVLELTREEDGDEDLLDGTLDSNDGNDAEDSVRSVPELQEPLRKR